MIPQTTYMALCRRSAHGECVRLPMPSGLTCIISLLQVYASTIVRLMAMHHGITVMCMYSCMYWQSPPSTHLEDHPHALSSKGDG